jgi:hypothetical protein
MLRRCRWLLQSAQRCTGIYPGQHVDDVFAFGLIQRIDAGDLCSNLIAHVDRLLMIKVRLLARMEACAVRPLSLELDPSVFAPLAKRRARRFLLVFQEHLVFKGLPSAHEAERVERLPSFAGIRSMLSRLNGSCGWRSIGIVSAGRKRIDPRIGNQGWCRGVARPESGQTCHDEDLPCPTHPDLRTAKSASCRLRCLTLLSAHVDAMRHAVNALLLGVLRHVGAELRSVHGPLV